MCIRDRERDLVFLGSERKVVVHDFFPDQALFLTVEEGPAVSELIYDTSKGPDICLHSADVIAQELGCHVTRITNKGTRGFRRRWLWGWKY